MFIEPCKTCGWRRYERSGCACGERVVWSGVHAATDCNCWKPEEVAADEPDLLADVTKEQLFTSIKVLDSDRTALEKERDALRVQVKALRAKYECDGDDALSAADPARIDNMVDILKHLTPLARVIAARILGIFDLLTDEGQHKAMVAVGMIADNSCLRRKPEPQPSKKEDK